MEPLEDVFANLSLVECLIGAIAAGGFLALYVGLTMRDLLSNRRRRPAERECDSTWRKARRLGLALNGDQANDGVDNEMNPAALNRCA